MKLSNKYLALGLLGTVLSAGSAYAATQSITGNVRFGTALVLSLPTAMDFGIVISGAGVYVLNSNTGGLSATSGTIIGGTTAAGKVHVVGDDTAAIKIRVTGYTPSTHVTLSLATCTYTDGVTPISDADCDGVDVTSGALAAGADLKLGATATVTTGGTTVEHPSMMVSITYS